MAALEMEVLLSYFPEIDKSVTVFTPLDSEFDIHYKELFRDCIVIETLTEMLMLQGEIRLREFSNRFILPDLRDELSLEDVDDVADTMLSLGKAIARRAWRFQARAMEMYLNGWAQIQVAKIPDASDSTRKKQLAFEFNSMLREIDAALEGPAAQEARDRGTKLALYDPNALVVVPSKDGFGRYSLQNRIDKKKRTGLHKSLLDIGTFRLIPDVPRKEGVVERARDKKGKFERTRQEPRKGQNGDNEMRWGID